MRPGGDRTGRQPLRPRGRLGPHDDVGRAVACRRGDPGGVPRPGRAGGARSLDRRAHGDGRDHDVGDEHRGGERMTRVDHRHRHLARIAEVKAGTSSEKVPYPIHIRKAEVVRTRRLSSALMRVTLGGPDLAGFEAHTPDDHVKLIFPDPDGTLRLPEPNGNMLRWPRPSPTTREYTVRHYDPIANEIDLDFVLHDGGLASEWARTVEAGEIMYVAGPPGGLIVPDNYDRYLLAGDITALPAIARWLETLPRTAAGWALIEVAD